MTQDEFNELKSDTENVFTDEVDSSVDYVPNGDTLNKVTLKAVVRENSDLKSGMVTIPTKTIEDASITVDREKDYFQYAGVDWSIDSIIPKPRLFNSSIITVFEVTRRYWVSRLMNAVLDDIQTSTGQDKFGEKTYGSSYTTVPCIWNESVRLEGDTQRTETHDASATIDASYSVSVGDLVIFNGQNYVIESISVDGEGLHAHTKELRLRRDV